MLTITSANNLRITNVVFKINVRDIVFKLRQSKVGALLDFTEYTNFSVIRGLCHLTLIAFTKSGHINITGVRRFDQLRDILILLSNILERDRCLDPNKAEIVSSTATGTVGCEVNLANLVYRYQTENESENPLSLYLQYGHFPSLLIRDPKARGCVQLFCSGKFNIVGCKDENSIEKLWRAVTALTKMYSFATRSSAVTADSF